MTKAVTAVVFLQHCPPFRIYFVPEICFCLCSFHKKYEKRKTKIWFYRRRL